MSGNQHMRVIRGPLHDGCIQYERELVAEWWELHGEGGYVAPHKYRRETVFLNRCPDERVVHVRRYRLKKGKSK